MTMLFFRCLFEERRPLSERRTLKKCQSTYLERGRQRGPTTVRSRFLENSTDPSMSPRIYSIEITSINVTCFDKRIACFFFLCPDLFWPHLPDLISAFEFLHRRRVRFIFFFLFWRPTWTSTCVKINDNDGRSDTGK